MGQRQAADSIGRAAAFLDSTVATIIWLQGLAAAEEPPMWYYLVTFLESILAVFGITAVFQQPRYAVVRSLPDRVQIRAYEPRTVVQTPADGDAFGRLFAYITGANAAHRKIAMTTPVEERGGRLGAPAADALNDKVTSPVMRFDLPRKFADDPPVPTDRRVTIKHLPAQTVATIAFSGALDAASIGSHARELERILASAGIVTQGEPFVLGYNPPFTIPFLRHNEVAVEVKA